MLLFYQFEFWSPPNDNGIDSDFITSLHWKYRQLLPHDNDVKLYTERVFEGLLDEDGSLIGEEDDCIDDDGAVDDDKLKEFIVQQEAENERKREKKM